MPRSDDLYGACRGLLDEAAVPQRVTIEGLRVMISVRRGRPLHLHPMPADVAAEAPCGVLVGFEGGGDHVFYTVETAPMRQEMAILHEFGHMLGDHQPGVNADPALARRLMPSQLGTVTHVFARSVYTTPQEKQAEMLATLLLGRLDTVAGVVPGRGARVKGRGGGLHNVFGIPES